jgi:hypothetical protein
VWSARLWHDAARRAAAQRAPKKYDGRVRVVREAAAVRREEREEAEGGGGGMTVIVKRYSDITEEEMRLAALGEP